MAKQQRTEQPAIERARQHDALLAAGLARTGVRETIEKLGHGRQLDRHDDVYRRAMEPSKHTFATDCSIMA